MRNMNIHQQIESLLVYYRDLQDDERNFVDQHLTHCTSCARQLDSYREMEQDLARLMEQEQSKVSKEVHRQQRVAFHAALDKENQSPYDPLLAQLLAFVQQGASVLLLVLLATGLGWMFQAQGLNNLLTEITGQSLPIATPQQLIPTPIPTPQQVIPIPQQLITATFGVPAQLELKGYNLESEDLGGGELKMRLILHLQVIDSPTSSYAIFTHLLDAEEGQLLHQQDVAMQNDHPPTTWQAGEIIMTPLEFTLSTLNQDAYIFVMGIYDSTTGERLPVLQDGKIQANGQVTLMEINKPSSTPVTP